MRKSLGNPRTLALTATATTQVIHDIDTFQGLKRRDDLFSRACVLKEREIDVVLVEGLRSKMLNELLKRVDFPCIVYASTIKEVEVEAKNHFWRKAFTKIDTFHSKRDAGERQTIQQNFLEGELNILLATSAFGMGINQSNIFIPLFITNFKHQKIKCANRLVERVETLNRCIALFRRFFTDET